jgi:putative transposase
MLRGNAGEDIFFTDVDRCRFSLILQESIEKFSFRIHGFCCMTDHIHIVLQVGQISLPSILQNISQRYTRWIDSTRQRTGHVFQGRYKAILLEANPYLIPLVRYIHRNPIRARMVSTLRIIRGAVIEPLLAGRPCHG